MVTVYALLFASTLAIAGLMGRTFWALGRFAYRRVNTVDASLPTVSVCVAARNETHALAQCLELILKSDYPKIEILVLDDSSDDDTSLIIKSFAHAGVRFVAGQSLPNGWLGKNHAYQTLIDESSGEYILFLDVDTTIQQTTISQLVSQLIANKKSMVSVLPRREDSQRASAIFGTMRYYWELLLATSMSPPAASALWMVKRSRLNDAGVGLANYSMSVRPERHLAGQLQRTKDYYYLIGTPDLGVGYEKRLVSQYETALRLYYPMTGRKMVNWLLSSIFLFLLILPLFTVTIFFYDKVLVVWSLTLTAMVAVTFGLFVRRTYGKVSWQLRVVIGPWLAIQELVLLLISYSRYRLGTVTWKGRLVNAQPTNHDAITLDE